MGDVPRVISCSGSDAAEGGSEERQGGLPHSTAVDRGCWPTNSMPGKGPRRAADNPEGYPHDPVSTGINGRCCSTPSSIEEEIIVTTSEPSASVLDEGERL